MLFAVFDSPRVHIGVVTSEVTISMIVVGCLNVRGALIQSVRLNTVLVLTSVGISLVRV